MKSIWIPVVGLLALRLSIGAAQVVAPGEREGAPDGLSARDWSGIHAAHEAGRHAAFAVEGGHRVRNPEQRWGVHFDGRGFLVEPEEGSWSWGLELERYGFARHEQRVTKPARVHAEGGRVIYAWGADLDEWFVNDWRGLEHGFTVQRRPTSDAEEAGGPLTFTLIVRGELRPEVTGDGRGVRFLDRGGRAVLTYTGLVVKDAAGRELEAGFTCAGAKLRLLVDERHARYPLTVDPIAQQAYLKASNTGRSDRFGFSVAMSGDTAVIGAINEASSATGVNGDQANNGCSGSGAAYVFVRTGSTWIQQAYLKASNPGPGDWFGYGVAVSGDTIVVGARYEESSATGVNGNPYDDSFPHSGAAYVYTRSGTTWTLMAYLKASNTDIDDNFGYSVAVANDVIVVGAPGEDSSATGVGGDGNDDRAPGAGAAYVFARNGATWVQQAYLKASNTEALDSFGRNVAISGDTVVIGAFQESSHAAGVNGDESDNSANRAGAAYVFVGTGATWTQEAYLKASNPDAEDWFGCSVAVSGDTILIGARREDSQAIGVNGDGGDDSANDAGAAYVFARSGSSWSQQAYLKPSNTDAGDFFGRSVSLSGDSLVVGADAEDGGAAGVNGDGADDSLLDSGAAYVFQRIGTQWSEEAYLKASNPDEGDSFGQSVAVYEETVVVGADWEDSKALGVGGDEGDDSLVNAGAAYLFDLGAPPDAACAWYCGTGANSSTDGLVITSPPVLGGTLSAAVTGCISGNAGAVLAAYAAPLSFPSPWGELLVDFTDPGGELLGLPSGLGDPTVIDVPVPNDPLLAGFELYVQAASIGFSFCLHCAYDCILGL